MTYRCKVIIVGKSLEDSGPCVSTHEANWNMAHFSEAMRTSMKTTSEKPMLYNRSEDRRVFLAWLKSHPSQTVWVPSNETPTAPRKPRVLS